MRMIFEWLTREGHMLAAWWLWITLAGVAVFPLCLRLLGGLPDSGYTLARAIGLLVVTAVFWLLSSCGFLVNSVGSIALAWLLVAVFCLALYRRHGIAAQLAAWWRENGILVLIAEALFVALLFGWALYRAHQNDLLGTEKPMELAFLSATQRSAAFPPSDPWMSGYAISYYYMGYVISASLALLTGVSSTISFNLTIAAQFALSGLAAFGVVYNLVRSRRSTRGAAMATGLLATLLLTLLGNFQFILIEAPFQTRAASQEYLEYWGTQMRSGFGEDGYRREPNAPRPFDSRTWDHWWWFRASRVLTDYDLDNRLTAIQPINEFPAFSFLLSDIHPHVLALPFVVMAIGLMLNLVLARRAPSAAEIALYGVVVGGLAFLNAWDGPIYLFGLLGAEALRRLFSSERGRLAYHDWMGLAVFGACLLVVAGTLYLPYFVGFRSQAGGILPNLIHPTLFRRFFIMFGPFLLVLVPYLAIESWRAISLGRMNWRLGAQVGGIALAALLGLMITLAVIIALRNPSQPALGNFEPIADMGEFIRLIAQRRIEYGLTSIALLTGIVVVVARIFPSRRQAQARGEVAITWVHLPPGTGFALLLIGMGLSLLLFTEFFYLKDNFGVRINTVFKLYYQAWALWSIAGAYAAYSALADRSLPRPNLALRLLLAIVIGLSLAGGLAYSVVGIQHRSWYESGRAADLEGQRYLPPADWEDPIRQVADGSVVLPGTVLFSRVNRADAAESDLIRAGRGGMVTFEDRAITLQQPLTLDGADGLLHPDDQSVINCLSRLVGKDEAVVAEAVERAYDIGYGRVGALAGIPVVLGWENHERQWRGQTYNEIAGSRRSDIAKLYSTPSIEDVEDIVNRYGIAYILFGTTERRQYGGQGEEKFLDHLPVLCQSGESSVYATDYQPA